MTEMKIGDRVMFSRTFCRSVGLVASNDPLVHRTKGGVIVALEVVGQSTFATIQDADDNTRVVLLANLVPVTARELD